MDADDICMSTRLEKQVAYLDSHPRSYYMWCSNRVFWHKE